MIYFWTIITSYLLGSIPFGYLAGKLAGVDVRSEGSGNIGATNVLRVLGKKYGYTVFIADVLKGFAAVRLALFFDGWRQGSLMGILAAVCAVVGHSFPIWLRFRGGKGVATSAGASLGLVPLAAVIAMSIWTITFLTFRFVSLASMIAAVALPLSVWLLATRERPVDRVLLSFVTLITALVILRHRPNIVRLMRGEEPRFIRK